MEKLLTFLTKQRQILQRFDQRQDFLHQHCWHIGTFFHLQSALQGNQLNTFQFVYLYVSKPGLSSRGCQGAGTAQMKSRIDFNFVLCSKHITVSKLLNVSCKTRKCLKRLFQRQKCTSFCLVIFRHLLGKLQVECTITT